MSRPRRTRAQIVADNDRALRKAAAKLLVERGWDGITFTGVAKNAGLTVGAVYGRFENSAELAIDLWDNLAGPWFSQRCADVLEAARSGDPDAVAHELSTWDDDIALSSLVVELLTAAMFDPDVAEVVGASAAAVLAPAVTPEPKQVTRHEAAAAVLTLSFTFGRAVAMRAGVAPAELSPPQFRVLAGAFGAPKMYGKIPQPVPLQWVRSVSSDDPAQDAILSGAIDVLGSVGYRRATIARIARRAGVPRGSVLSHYRDKVHLLADAVDRELLTPDQVWSQYAPVIEQYGPLLSRAIFLADFLQEGNRKLWAVNLELARISALVPELGTFRPSPQVLGQTHLGVMLVASFSPDLSKLPFAGPFNSGTAT